MVRSSRSRPPSNVAVYEEKAEDPPMTSLRRQQKTKKGRSATRTASKLFDRMKTGSGLASCLQRTEDTFDDICDAMNQDWEDLYHGLLVCVVKK
jgi:hypothetical protein